MNLYELIIDSYPQLEGSNFFADGTILLQDDSDGLGAYIAKWEYDEPIPEGLKLGK